MNKDMLRNVLQTDPSEVNGLVNPDLLVHAVLLGLVPAVLGWKIRLPKTARSVQLWGRLLVGVGALAIAALGLLGCSADYAAATRSAR